MFKISQILEQYIKDYKDIIFEEESNNSKIFSAFNITTQRSCILKVINKNNKNFKDYSSFQRQIKREEEITTLCKSEYTVNLYRTLETKEYIIFELEYYDSTIYNFIQNNGPLLRNLDFFKYIVHQLANALKIVHHKGIMHRDIKPQNFFLKAINGENKIKLGNFSCSIFIKHNTSEPIGTFIYSSPEIISENEYNEKSDLWSLGITLFEIFFGYPPYGPEPTPDKIKNIVLDDKNNFIIKKTNIPTLDILFKRLLVINPDIRMSYNEFFNYVFSQDFMKKDVIYVNNNKIYKKIYFDILKEPEINFKLEKPEKTDEKVIKKNCKKKILSEVNGINFPDIISLLNEIKEKHNNIIYYDERIDHIRSINKDNDYFERHTPGAFIFCSDLESLRLVRAEILNEIIKDQGIDFNLITTGSSCIKIMEFLKEDKVFEICINNVCIYCSNIEKYIPLKNIYNIIHNDMYTRKHQVVDFIKMSSSEYIQPFPLTKLITYEDYIKKYKNRHFKVSTFYGDLTLESYQKYIKEMIDLIDKKSESNELLKNKNRVNEGFLSFDLGKDIRASDVLIINEYTRYSFSFFLNKLLMNNMEFHEPVAYFTARLMYGLNKYAKENKKYSEENREFYSGANIPYTSILTYIRAKGKIIILPSFISTYESIVIAERLIRRKESNEIYKNQFKFSVLFYIKNIYKNNWISSGINIQDVSSNKKEKEHLFLPFTFYYVRDVRIDIKNHTADIYLETIGKKGILEEEIKNGKEIEYNKNENIIQIKEK